MALSSFQFPRFNQRSVAFPAQFQIGFPGRLGLLDEAVEHVYGFLVSSNVEHSVLVVALNPNLHDAGADIRHRLEILRHFDALDQVQLVDPRPNECQPGPFATWSQLSPIQAIGFRLDTLRLYKIGYVFSSLPVDYASRAAFFMHDSPTCQSQRLLNHAPVRPFADRHDQNRDRQEEEWHPKKPNGRER
ncbi:MAG: hypothetical protein U0Q16_15610 [Bryobacteraceae bacterium]